MASIYKEIIIDAHPDDVWDALRDFGAVHTRLAPGFVLDTKLDGDARIVTLRTARSRARPWSTATTRGGDWSTPSPANA
jgi:hypothetical protein